MNDRVFHLFVYGTFLAGEPNHAVLAGGERLTEAAALLGHALYDLGAVAGAAPFGLPEERVLGELYAIDYDTLRACDLRAEHPHLFHRATVHLEGGREAEAYLLRPEQVRGRRRLKGGDWRRRFAASAPPGAEVGTLRHWLKGRTVR
jgi:gamma-glutamylcyclotransferase (GGCT)/AIG2-like uncharacterized protein YtfP